jgi:hypothetical protein
VTKIYRYYIDEKVIKEEVIECEFDGICYFILSLSENIVIEKYLDSGLYYIEYYDSGIRDGYFYSHKMDHSTIIDLYINENDKACSDLCSSYYSSREKLYLKNIELKSLKLRIDKEAINES